MDLKQAREAVKANYPPENYTILRESLDWLIEQAEKLEKIKTAYVTNEVTISEFMNVFKGTFEKD
jgi:iron-sulfur cluster repair protein YtfE (RIC family)